MEDRGVGPHAGEEVGVLPAEVGRDDVQLEEVGQPLGQDLDVDQVGQLVLVAGVQGRRGGHL